MSLKERIIRELRSAISRREYQPGEHLTEAALCERFKVSRTPIREALNQLEKEGFVKIVPAAGARVVEISFQDAMDIYDLLIVLEGAASRLACNFLTEKDLAKLEEYNFLFERAAATKNHDLLFEVNWQLHWLITETTRNTYLMEVRSNYRRLVDQIGRIFPRIPEQPEVSVREHRQIIEALKARNAALSEFLMREHLEGAKTRLAQFLQEEGWDATVGPERRAPKKDDAVGKTAPLG